MNAVSSLVGWVLDHEGWLLPAVAVLLLVGVLVERGESRRHPR